MQSNTVTIALKASVATVNERTACLIAFLLGASMVFAVGFAQIDVLHNGTHDTRHTLGFPCH